MTFILFKMIKDVLDIMFSIIIDTIPSELCQTIFCVSWGSKEKGIHCTCLASYVKGNVLLNFSQMILECYCGTIEPYIWNFIVIKDGLNTFLLFCQNFKITISISFHNSIILNSAESPFVSFLPSSFSR